MTAYPLSTLAPVINENGISYPPYSDVYQSLIATFKNIYGEDIYVSPDSQDGQLIGILAKAIDDSNKACVAAFLSFSPTYAQGVGLSSNVKINGLSRKPTSKSTATGSVAGVVGSTIINGIVKDVNGEIWELPSPVVIGISGETIVTVTCKNEGNIRALAGEINTIGNPQLGWQSFVNTADASPGNPIETDPELKSRQKISTSLPSLTVLEGIKSSILNLSGVTKIKCIENDTDVTDSDGVPRKSISLIVQGGDSTEIATQIAKKKTPGGGTYGDISITTFDQFGMPNLINFFRPTDIYVSIEITIQAFTGYSSTTGDLIKQAAVDFVSVLGIGEHVYLFKLISPINLPGNELSDSFNITQVRLKKGAGSFAVADVVIAFNELAITTISGVTLIVV